MTFTLGLARLDDVLVLRSLRNCAIRQFLEPFLPPAAVAKEGFSRAQLAATLAGEPLYRACGYLPVEHFTSPTGPASTLC